MIHNNLFFPFKIINFFCPCAHFPPPIQILIMLCWDPTSALFGCSFLFEQKVTFHLSKQRRCLVFFYQGQTNTLFVHFAEKNSLFASTHLNFIIFINFRPFRNCLKLLAQKFKNHKFQVSLLSYSSPGQETRFFVVFFKHPNIEFFAVFRPNPVPKREVFSKCGVDFDMLVGFNKKMSLF